MKGGEKHEEFELFRKNEVLQDRLVEWLDYCSKTEDQLKLLTRHSPVSWGIVKHSLLLFETKQEVSDGEVKEDPYDLEIYTTERALEEYLWAEGDHKKGYWFWHNARFNVPKQQQQQQQQPKDIALPSTTTSTGRRMFRCHQKWVEWANLEVERRTGSKSLQNLMHSSNSLQIVLHELRIFTLPYDFKPTSEADRLVHLHDEENIGDAGHTNFVVFNVNSRRYFKYDPNGTNHRGWVYLDNVDALITNHYRELLGPDWVYYQQGNPSSFQRYQNKTVYLAQKKLLDEIEQKSSKKKKSSEVLMESLKPQPNPRKSTENTNSNVRLPPLYQNCYIWALYGTALYLLNHQNHTLKEIESILRDGIDFHWLVDCVKYFFYVELLTDRERDRINNEKPFRYNIFQQLIGWEPYCHPPHYGTFLAPKRLTAVKRARLE
eukprot:NODE_1795_length_1805_cov_33.360880_g1524_i0.p1 GENE.NODE_1795_length_1805_cov_33.360880_g1524_i0~~NODE_1795_length_1805_cov_33.360880_g1524_i0.p1  ORF type:complete len:433 (-),score=91.76 NODE_1795_length_1805_cov_33.360880_g1524_i0:41-1339(-)